MDKDDTVEVSLMILSTVLIAYSTEAWTSSLSVEEDDILLNPIQRTLDMLKDEMSHVFAWKHVGLCEPS